MNSEIKSAANAVKAMRAEVANSVGPAWIFENSEKNRLLEVAEADLLALCGNDVARFIEAMDAVEAEAAADEIECAAARAELDAAEAEWIAKHYAKMF